MAKEKGLSQQKCVPCQVGAPKLSLASAHALLTHLSGWKLVDNATKIEKEMEFKDFVSAMKFVNKAAKLAETIGHHPNIAISWNKVRFTNYTHKIRGLHQNDFILAAKIDEL